MIIIIPIGGNGTRFKNNGYVKPKSLIDVCDKPIIFHLLDNLTINNIEYIYIPYNKEYLVFNFENLLIQRYPNINFKFFILHNNTRGAAETIKLAIDNIDIIADKSVLCLDSDNFYLCDILNKWNGSNCIFTFKDYNINPIYSYVEWDKNNNIINIKEKEKISDLACTGAYGFNSIIQLKTYINYIIDNNIKQKDEFYTSGVIKEMIENSIKFNNIEILNKDYFSLGTPKLVHEYENPFLFDLDGTLVNTDNIYTKVWNNIMNSYGLSIDDIFFKFYIQGNNDASFINNIFPNISNTEINKISNLKDKLFIEYLNNYDNDILLPGALQFIKQNKNRKMVIVTNCNRKSAEYIINKTGIMDYIQFIISSDECKIPKPNKEPYEQAIYKLGYNKYNCTIFEDSISGYKSAISLGGTNICIILNNSSSDYMINLNEYKIKNYNDFDIINLKLNTEDDFTKIISHSLNSLPIKSINKNIIDLKTGYICDIKSFKITFNDNTTKDVILKVENKDNILSNIAQNLNLYYNEKNFYENISNNINIKTPYFFGSVLDNDKITIILEDITYLNGSFNLNLNNIDTILSVIKNITNMHNRFLFQDKNNIICCMKDLLKINEIHYYKDLIDLRINLFFKYNKKLLSINETNILNNIYKNYNLLLNAAGKFPLNFCHGDLKSPNIFYNQTDNDITPIFLDWQYIHLNKGISDIVFLLLESTDYNEEINTIIINYYYKKSIMYNDFDIFMQDFKISLCIFPFFVMIWFNSENKDSLLDKVFPIRFMKNTLKFYNKYLDNEFFNNLASL